VVLGYTEIAMPSVCVGDSGYSSCARENRSFIGYSVRVYMRDRDQSNGRWFSGSYLRIPSSWTVLIANCYSKIHEHPGDDWEDAISHKYSRRLNRCSFDRTQLYAVLNTKIT